jgi:hypothetical protein
MLEAREAKLAGASDRVEESSRRAAHLVHDTALKNARHVQRAIAVVAGRNEAEAADAQAALDRLTARMANAAARRAEAMEAARPASERLDQARAELARLEADRAEKKHLLQLSLDAASERRAAGIEDKVCAAIFVTGSLCSCARRPCSPLDTSFLSGARD